MPPREDFWLLFKVSSYERLIQMQKGILYMNSLEYFSNLKGEESLSLRKYDLENVYRILKAGVNEKCYSTLSLSININDAEQEFDLGSEAVLTAKFPRSQNTMIFCMGAFADGQDGFIPGEVDGKLLFDKRFLGFGSHLLLITDAKEFSKRIEMAIQNEKYIFSSVLFHKGYGLVSYKDLKNYSEAIGLYTKDIKYSWQMEFRIVFGVEDKLLNSKGAYEFSIGDISDISKITTVQSFIDEPLIIKRRSFKKVGDNYELINR
jgi:hypothetical protein